MQTIRAGLARTTRHMRRVSAERLPVVLAIALSLLAACADPAVRQKDLDAWVGMPVAALDTQSLFATIPMIRTHAENGDEIRNYASGRGFSSCAGSQGKLATGTYVSADAFANQRDP